MDWFNPFKGSENGGGSGTDNYNDLKNKPSINDVTLSGNKTSDDLGLQEKIDSNNKISSDNVDDLGAENLFTNALEKAAWNAVSENIIIESGIKVYIGSTAPTGTIPEGSIGIGF